MGIVIETFINCDFCGKSFGVDNRYRHRYQHRDAAKKEGWIFLNGKDFCDECKIKLLTKQHNN